MWRVLAHVETPVAEGLEGCVYWWRARRGPSRLSAVCTARGWMTYAYWLPAVPRVVVASGSAAMGAGVACGCSTSCAHPARSQKNEACSAESKRRLPNACVTVSEEDIHPISPFVHRAAGVTRTHHAPDAATPDVIADGDWRKMTALRSPNAPSVDDSTRARRTSARSSADVDDAPELGSYRAHPGVTAGCGEEWGGAPA